MFRRLLSRSRGSGPPPDAPDEEPSEDAFLRALLDTPVEPTRRAPTYLADAAPKPPPRRPYLDVSRAELARYTRAEEVRRGPGLGAQVQREIAEWLDRLLLAPVRDVFGNLGVIGVTALVIAGTAAAAWTIMELVSWWLGPLAS